MFTEAIRAFKEVVATWNGYEDYLPRINYLMKNAAEIGRKCYIPNESGQGYNYNSYNVLNHGDFHSRNLLTKFSEDTNRLEKFQFVIKLVVFRQFFNN